MEESINPFPQNPQNTARYDDIESQHSMVAEDHVSYGKRKANKMAVPKYEELMKTLLKAVSDGQTYKIKDIYANLV
jgi:hypothetical protein